MLPSQSSLFLFGLVLATLCFSHPRKPSLITFSSVIYYNQLISFKNIANWNVPLRMVDWKLERIEPDAIWSLRIRKMRIPAGLPPRAMDVLLWGKNNNICTLSLNNFDSYLGRAQWREASILWLGLPESAYGFPRFIRPRFLQVNLIMARHLLPKRASCLLQLLHLSVGEARGRLVTTGRCFEFLCTKCLGIFGGRENVWTARAHLQLVANLMSHSERNSPQIRSAPKAGVIYDNLFRMFLLDFEHVQGKHSKAYGNSREYLNNYVNDLCPYTYNLFLLHISQYTV